MSIAHSTINKILNIYTYKYIYVWICVNIWYAKQNFVSSAVKQKLIPQQTNIYIYNVEEEEEEVTMTVPNINTVNIYIYIIQWVVYILKLKTVCFHTFLNILNKFIQISLSNLTITTHEMVRVSTQHNTNTHTPILGTIFLAPTKECNE